MTKKLILLIIVMVSVTISSFAQEGASVFQNYKYRFQKYRLLTTNFGMGNNNVMSENIQQSNSSSNSASDFSMHGSVIFNQIINTQKLQQITNYGGSLSYGNYRNNNSFSSYSQRNNAAVFINLSQHNRFYTKNHFFELNYGISTNEQYGKSKRNNLPSYENNLDFYGGISFGAGQGRLEMVGDVAQALFILTDFKNRGIITNYTSEDATALAKTITKIYNTRIIDFRYRMRGQLGMLDSFFSASGLIDASKSQSAYFISLFDNWLNNNYVQRYCGSRFSYGLNYGKRYSNNFNYQAKTNNYLFNNNKVNYNLPGVYFNYTYEKPISLHWQETFFVDVAGSNIFIGNKNFQVDTFGTYSRTTKHSYINTQLTATYKLSWYPNSRTYINAGVTSVVLYNPEDIKTLKTTPVSLLLAPSANLFYFVNPKMNFNITVAPVFYVSHRFLNNSSIINLLAPAFNAGLNYYIY